MELTPNEQRQTPQSNEEDVFFKVSLCLQPTREVLDTDRNCSQALPMEQCWKARAEE